MEMPHQHSQRRKLLCFGRAINRQLVGDTWVSFCWVCAAGFSQPLPHYSLFCGHIIIDHILVTLEKK